MVKIFETARSAGTARCYLSALNHLLDDVDEEGRDEKNQLFIADIRRDPRSGIDYLLINRGDPNAVSPALINAVDNSVRTITPEKEEAPGFSAHLIISTVSNGGRYRACFEKMSGLSSHLVGALLDRLLARAADKNPKYTYDVAVKTKTKIGTKRKRYRPVFEIRRVPSENLEKDLERGELSRITLTKRKISYDGTGPKSLIRRQEEKVVFTTAPADKGKVVSLVKGITNWARKHDYESIQFDVEKLPGNQSSRPTLLLADDHDALEQLYVRAQIIAGFGDILEGCYQEICAAIEDKMISVVHGDW